MDSTSQRKPHAVLNLDSRLLKAKKIEMLLNLPASQSTLRLLEIGTGSGGIANYFANMSKQRFVVDAIDVADNRLISDGYNFQLVNDVVLPFEDGSFDVVITNHVIEHVGLYERQCEHLQEIRRVLKKNGVGYLAVPNRWMLVEPHYKLIFLSWLPVKLRSAYLKLSGKGNFYDCEPLEKYKIEEMFLKSKLNYSNECIQAMKLTLLLEKPKSIFSKAICFLPDAIYKPFLPLIPTLIYTLQHKNDVN